MVWNLNQDQPFQELMKHRFSPTCGVAQSVQFRSDTCVRSGFIAAAAAAAGLCLGSKQRDSVGFMGEEGEEGLGFGVARRRH